MQIKMMMNKNGNAPAIEIEIEIEIVCSGLRVPERNRTYAATGSVFFQSDKITETCPVSLLSISLKAVNADCKLRSWMTAFPLAEKKWEAPLQRFPSFSRLFSSTSRLRKLLQAASPLLLSSTFPANNP